MCAAAIRTEKAYSIPRNSLVPEPSVLDVLASGTLFKSREGNTEGFPMPLFHAGGEAGAQMSMQKPGTVYYFKCGFIYVYDEARTAAAQLFDGVMLTAAFTLPGLGEMAGALSTFVEKGGEMLLDKINEKITEKLSDRNRQSPMTFGDQVAMLERRGMVVLPGVTLVAVEHQVEPAGFLSKENHRVVLTFEDGAHQLNRYQLGAPMKGNKAETADVAIKMALTARMWGETGYLFQMVKAEYAPGFGSISSEMQAAFEKLHGEGTAYRSPEFVKSVDDRYSAEVERNGFNTTVGGQRVLELLEPMREVYDRTPVLQGMMQNMRALAAGRTE